MASAAAAAAAAAVYSLQSCLTLRDPTDSSPPGSRIPGILQARTLEWVAISFSNDGIALLKRERDARALPLSLHPVRTQQQGSHQVKKMVLTRTQLTLAP